MEDKKLKNVIGQIKKVSLSQDEKSKILHNLSVYADFHRAILSPSSLFSYFKNSNKKFAYVLASVIILILAGGTAVYASEDSLPGDLLYPIKTKVVEPIKVALATTPAAKADVEASLAVERLKEAETLDQKGKLTPNIKKEIDGNLSNDMSNFFKIKNQMEGTTTDSTSSEIENTKIKAEFENRLGSHKEMFNKLNHENSYNPAQKMFQATSTGTSTNSYIRGNAKNMKMPDSRSTSSGYTKENPFQNNY